MWAEEQAGYWAELAVPDACGVPEKSLERAERRRSTPLVVGRVREESVIPSNHQREAGWGNTQETAHNVTTDNTAAASTDLQERWDGWVALDLDGGQPSRRLVYDPGSLSLPGDPSQRAGWLCFLLLSQGEAGLFVHGRICCCHCHCLHHKRKEGGKEKRKRASHGGWK